MVRTAAASLADLIFGSPAATYDGRRGQVSLPAGRRLCCKSTMRFAMTLLLNVDVPDVETGVRFYTAAFGLEFGRRFGTDFVALFGWPAKVYLLAKAAGTVGAGRAFPGYGS